MKKKSFFENQWSKIVTIAAMIMGVVVLQECFVLMLLCILRGYTAAAAWLTAAVAVAEALLITVPASYHSLVKSEHTEGGITFEAAKAKNFADDTGSADSPAI